MKYSELLYYKDTTWHRQRQINWQAPKYTPIIRYQPINYWRMDDTNNTSPPRGQRDRTADQSTSSQLISNDTTTRTGDRDCTQKLTITSLKKHDNSSEYLWWRKFVQYIKMTKDIDLSQMTTTKEILSRFRDQLELEIKDTYLWAIGQSALPEWQKR